MEISKDHNKATASYQGTVTTLSFPSIVLLYSSCEA